MDDCGSASDSSTNALSDSWAGLKKVSPEQLLRIQNVDKPVTFIVEGDSMEPMMNEGDELVVDRDIVNNSHESAFNGKVIIASLNHEYTVKRFSIENKIWYLVPENIKRYERRIITEEDNFFIKTTCTPSHK